MQFSFMQVLMDLNAQFTLFCVFPAMVILGLYLTIKLRFVQIFKLKLSFKNLMKKKLHEEGDISHFEAISAVLAGNFGTGNISGMAVALTAGGPGALVWMWVMAFLGSSIQYASCFLGVKYRTQNEAKEYMGGPMYYLANGLRYKKLAVIFAVLTLFGAVTVGGFAQINSMVLPLEKMGWSPLGCGLIAGVCVALVIVGGLQRMARFASLIVPLKAFLYLAAALLVIGLNLEKLVPALSLMFRAAVDPQAAVGGIMGIGVLQAITTGFDRGIFATDAGTGIVPILQSSARSQNPVVDGLVALVAPFMVMIVCTTTGLILLMTGACETGLQSTNMVTYAFETGLGSSAGGYVVMVALILFGFTTILAWACCAEKAAGFLWGNKNRHWVKGIYLALIPIGAIAKVELVWTLADLCITAMVLINMIGIAGMAREVVEESREYFSQEALV